ncbi:MAG: Signal transduction histidine-protein kinase BarA [bacterium ADurb.Bin243]|nr:MAG: Signal transduction histidine-protein kinase BarA [bacterium ADurb.Bin243]
MQNSKVKTRKRIVNSQAYLDALIEVNHKLLKFDDNDFYPDMLELLALSTNSEHAYYFETAGDSHEYVLKIRSRWSKDGSPDITDESGLLSSGLLKQLSCGKMLSKKVSKLKAADREMFSDRRVASCLAVPITVSEKYHGYIRLDNLTDENNYSTADANFLKSAAKLLSIAIEYRASYDKLQASHHELRNLFYEKINQLEKLSKTIKSNVAPSASDKTVSRQNYYFNQFFNNTRDIIYITDLEGNFLSVNSFVECLTGYKREEIISKNIINFIMPEYVTIYKKMLEMAQVGLLNQANYEIKFKSKTGEILYFEINNYVISPAGEKPSEILGIARNISELKNNEKKINSLKNDFYGVINSPTDAIMSFKPKYDQNNKIIDFEWAILNNAAEKLLDKKSGELIGRSMLENLDNNSIESLFDRFVHTYESHIPLYYEHNYKFKDMNLWLRVSAIRHNDSLIMSLSDVTYQKQSEKELQEQLNFNEILLDSLPYPALLINKDRRILAFNQIARDLGASYETDCWELFNHDKGCRNKLFHELSNCFFCYADNCLENRSSVKCFEQNIGNKNLLMNLLHIYDDIFLYFAIDITESKKMLTQIEYANAKVQKSDNLKRQFLCNMSHELRTPMNIIIGFAELLSETSLEGEQKEYLKQIKTSSLNLLSIINDIIDFSNIEAERLEIKNEEFSLIDTLEEAISKNIELCESKNLKLLLNFDQKINFKVYSDQERLKQVLLNLINNAVKFTEHGKVCVNVTLEPVETAENRAVIKFEIIDEGIGIDEEKQKELFSPFMQADTSLTRRFGGTGLGLTISNHLVRLLGSSKIFCESKPSQGSNFYFVIDFLKGGNL